MILTGAWLEESCKSILSYLRSNNFLEIRFNMGFQEIGRSDFCFNNVPRPRAEMLYDRHQVYQFKL